MRNRCLVALVAVILAACGGSGGGSTPSTPTSPGAPAVFTVLDGWDDRPVAGATIESPGASVVTDAGGRAQVAAPAGAEMHLRAAGYFDRDTLQRAGGDDGRSGVLTLWPAEPGGPDYVRAVVYGPTSLQGRLSRPALGATFRILPSAEIQADGPAMDSLQRAADLITAAADGRVRWSLVTSGPAEITAAIDAAAGGQGAVSTVHYVNFLVQNVEMVFRDISVVRSPAAPHELGHAFGLSHSPDASDLMFPTITRRTQFAFSDRERLVIRMMTRRRPGTAPLDDDRQATSTATGRRGVVRTICD
jgi:hypothetical protein